MLEGSQQQTSPVESSTAAAEEVTFHMPQGPNLAGPNGRQLAAESAAAGLEALPHMAEIYPLGGQALVYLQCTEICSMVLFTCPSIRRKCSLYNRPNKSIHCSNSCSVFLLVLHLNVLTSHWRARLISDRPLPLQSS